MKKRVYPPCTADWHNAILVRDIKIADEAVEWLRSGPPPEDTRRHGMSGTVVYLYYDDLDWRTSFTRFEADRNNPEMVRRMISDILTHRGKLAATPLWKG